MLFHDICWPVYFKVATRGCDHPRRPRGSQSGRETSTSTGERAPGYRLSLEHFQKFKPMPAPNWAQKMLCIIVPNRRTHLLSSFRVFVHDGYCLDHGLPGSCTKEMHAVRKLQFAIKSPSDIKILSARKLKTLFQKYKRKLTTRIQACIGHVLRKYIYREFLKIDTKIDSLLQ